MNDSDLSKLVKDLVNATFRAHDRQKACSLLTTSCSLNLPMVENDFLLIERIQTAVIKQAGGNLTTMEAWINEAQEDWRDVLDSAGFYSDPHAHRSWRP